MNAQLNTKKSHFCAFAGDSIGAPMFSVNAGVPIESALASASCLLEIVQKILTAGADSDGLDATQVTAALIIVDQSKACIDSAWAGVEVRRDIEIASAPEGL